MLWAQSTTKVYIWAEHKLQPISKLFIQQVIIPLDFLFSNHSSDSTHNFGTQNQKKNQKKQNKKKQQQQQQQYVLEPITIPQALNTGTCIQQGDLFYSAGLHRSQC